jgi:polysaccharide export outer membrane protein
LLLPGLIGCSTVPRDGPASIDLSLSRTEDASVAAAIPYVVAQLDAQVLARIKGETLRLTVTERAGGWRGSREQTIGIGDRLTVNIWEPSPDGLFSTPEERQATVRAVVENDGKVYIPYIGRITAVRRSAESLRGAIEQGLAGKAIEPQVQVLVEDNQANAVVVLGDVARPGQLQLPASGLRLLDAVARAGGSRGPAYETLATVSSGGRSQSLRLDSIAASAEQNLWLAPGDNVLVLHQPRTFSAFGAVRLSGLLPFKSGQLSLAEALAEVGGLEDGRADARGVFLFRFEDQALAQWLVATGKGSGSLDAQGSGRTAVIYRIDFARPGAFFIAQGLSMRDKDIIYVANHPATELYKFITMIVAPFLTTARSTAVLAND